MHLIGRIRQALGLTEPPVDDPDAEKEHPDKPVLGMPVSLEAEGEEDDS